MAKAKKQQNNLLDYIPVRNPRLTWDVKNGKVTLHRENKGIFFWFGQKLWKKPRFSHIELEEFGSFLWQNMDGKRDVGDLADMLKAEFGEKAEPLYERVVKYINILKNNKFISLIAVRKK